MVDTCGHRYNIVRSALVADLAPRRRSATGADRYESRRAGAMLPLIHSGKAGLRNDSTDSVIQARTGLDRFGIYAQLNKLDCPAQPKERGGSMVVRINRRAETGSLLPGYPRQESNLRPSA